MKYCDKCRYFNYKFNNFVASTYGCDKKVVSNTLNHLSEPEYTYTVLVPESENANNDCKYFEEKPPHISIWKRLFG